MIGRYQPVLPGRANIAIHCLLCRGLTPYAQPLCQRCLDSLPVPASFCSRCGLPMAAALSDRCGQCVRAEPDFDHCVTAWVYDYPVDIMIQQIKYHRRLELLAPMAVSLGAVLRDYYTEQPWPDTIIPVPLHWRRLQSRGFNQALLIAEKLASTLPKNVRCTVNPHTLSRSRDTPPQQQLPAKARHNNVKGAFTLRRAITGRHVAIVDDVVTTAATVNTISRLLKQHGVQQVDVWCLARTPMAQ